MSYPVSIQRSVGVALRAYGIYELLTALSENIRMVHDWWNISGNFKQKTAAIVYMSPEIMRFLYDDARPVYFQCLKLSGPHWMKLWYYSLYIYIFLTTMSGAPRAWGPLVPGGPGAPPPVSARAWRHWWWAFPEALHYTTLLYAYWKCKNMPDNW